MAAQKAPFPPTWHADNLLGKGFTVLDAAYVAQGQRQHWRLLEAKDRRAARRYQHREHYEAVETLRLVLPTDLIKVERH
jgi:hypothetical protein